jgi:hypothetical protein
MRGDESEFVRRTVKITITDTFYPGMRRRTLLPYRGLIVVKSFVAYTVLRSTTT